MGKAQFEELEKNGVYLSVPRGISMWPMIINKEGIVEIHKLTEPAKRYDLVVYVRGEEQGVIHRVVYVFKNHYAIIGDNCWRFEFVKKSQVKGIVTKFYRKGKWYDVDNKWYKLYVHIWVDLLFIKRPLFFLREKFFKLIGKKRNV
ncbi:S24/S26 family peptidase [Ruminococcus sp.]|uniref:S24/S26 family peptidase n=1 Tax=Ruminococcus sp. TaxID=41978 RepID=UPI00260079DD|nr:S24/S26 family peptidase [Ruminococcus sp.]MBQ8967154.1 S24/S26 family peptidase [Ruminococcus sp.]